MSSTENAPLRSGLCLCIAEPRGHAGLEGYIAGDFYRFEHLPSDKNNKPYFRLYPSNHIADFYETCSEVAFGRFFEAQPS